MRTLVDVFFPYSFYGISLQRILFCLPGIALLSSGHSALAAQVKGKLSGIERLANPVWNEAKEANANRYTWREPSPTVRPEFRSLFPLAPKEICVVAEGETGAPAGPPLAVRVGGGRTSPVTLVVPPGTTLEFQNRDPFLHRIFVVNQPSFHATDLRAGASRQWMVPGPGTYELRDELTPSVRSWIIVDPTFVARTYPSRDGTFVFGNLPAGNYTLKVYVNGALVGRPSAVKATDRTLEIKDPIPLAADAPPGGKDKG